LADAWHVKHLIDRAHALGADRAAPLPAAAVVVDERVRLKCRVPLCSSYGRNLMCPPHVPGPDETRAALARYDDVLLVQRHIPVTQADVDAALGGRSYAEARVPGGADPATTPGDAGACDEAVVAAQQAFAKLMSELEREAFKLGYRFAAAFAGGDCVLCQVCEGVEDGVCRHPFEARPSMEAVGVDVVATARAAGLEVELPAAERPTWTGMLLID
jgi:predicted metal-binding protein